LAAATLGKTFEWTVRCDGYFAFLLLLAVVVLGAGASGFEP
jgi:hypothetical protein